MIDRWPSQFNETIKINIIILRVVLYQQKEKKKMG